MFFKENYIKYKLEFELYVWTIKISKTTKTTIKYLGFSFIIIIIIIHHPPMEVTLGTVSDVFQKLVVTFRLGNFLISHKFVLFKDCDLLICQPRHFFMFRGNQSLNRFKGKQELVKRYHIILLSWQPLAIITPTNYNQAIQ